MVLSAAQRLDPESSEALAGLCEKYWYPLYAYIRKRGYAAEHAQDLTQEFFLRLLEKQYIGRADRNKGRFRSFLLSSLTYFLCDEADRRKALKRGGSVAILPFEIHDGEEMFRREPVHNETPEKLFERRWALALLERGMTRLREEFLIGGDPVQFDLLKPFLVGDDASARYADLARELRTTEGALKVAIHRLRRRYRAIMREEIAETVADPNEIESEIRYLAAVLAKR
jgi:DNA-directed RNA polymerase specialized sigma24 family protein